MPATIAASWRGDVLGPRVRDLAMEMARAYVDGNLVVVAGAGVSRSSNLPGWETMVASLEASAASDLAENLEADELHTVLRLVHRGDPIGTADSLQRLLGAPSFRRHLHSALYPRTPEVTYRPSATHWHIVSLIDRALMKDVFTSNYDDLLETAKRNLGRPGRVRHFHGRLPQGWSGISRLADPPVVTSRDYAEAETGPHYDRLAQAIQDKTALLVGFSLFDPNLTRMIRKHARDCRSILVASPHGLSRTQQGMRLRLMSRYWDALSVRVTAIEAYEELPAFFLVMRREIERLQGRNLSALGARALKATVSSNASLVSWRGVREWRARLREAVAAAKQLTSAVRGDRTLRSGFYAIRDDGFLEHAASSMTIRTDLRRARRRLLADDPKPWGAAGYAFGAGVEIASSSAGGVFDRNVPEAELLAWQGQRTDQRRLPAAAVLSVPAWVRYRGHLVPVGVMYYSSRRGDAFDDPNDDDEFAELLQLTFADMIKPDHAVKGRV